MVAGDWQNKRGDHIVRHRDVKSLYHMYHTSETNITNIRLYINYILLFF